MTQPLIKPHLNIILKAYSELESQRPISEVGVGPIPYLDIVHYGEFHGYPYPLIVYMIDLLVVLDREFMKYQREDMKAIYGKR